MAKQQGNKKVQASDERDGLRERWFPSIANEGGEGRPDSRFCSAPLLAMATAASAWARQTVKCLWLSEGYGRGSS
jgi:hypothetical protein